MSIEPMVAYRRLPMPTDLALNMMVGVAAMKESINYFHLPQGSKQ